MRTTASGLRASLGGCLVAFLTALGGNLYAQERPAPSCRLNIEGQAIEQLVLERRSCIFDPCSQVLLNKPGATVDLPAGEYRVVQVVLQGGCVCPGPMQAFDSTRERFRDLPLLQLTPEKPQVLRIGGPLRASLATCREGRSVRVAFRLQDVEGRLYASKACNAPPLLTVLCNGRPLVSASPEAGNFAYS